MRDHLELAAEGMGEEHREEIDLIPDPGAGRYIAERVVGFELGEASVGRVSAPLIRRKLRVMTSQISRRKPRQRY
jgi:hypothetical protein